MDLVGDEQYNTGDGSNQTLHQLVHMRVKSEDFPGKVSWVTSQLEPRAQTGLGENHKNVWSDLGVHVARPGLLGC